MRFVLTLLRKCSIRVHVNLAELDFLLLSFLAEAVHGSDRDALPDGEWEEDLVEVGLLACFVRRAKHVSRSRRGRIFLEEARKHVLLFGDQL